MKPFRFPLVAILTLREEREQQAQRAYADRLRTVESIQQALHAARQELTHLASEQQSRLNRGAQAQDLRRLDRYRLVLNERLNRLERDLAAARLAAEQAWQALLKATQDRQALEQYRDKLLRLHAAALAREDQKLLDDLSARAPTLATAWRQPAETSLP